MKKLTIEELLTLKIVHEIKIHFFIFRKTIMEIVDTSTKIKCLVEMALKGEMTWFTLNSLIDGLTLNLDSSRQINRILLKEFEKHQLVCTVKKSDTVKQFSKDVINIDEDQSIQITEQGKCSEETLMNLESEDLTCVDNEIDLFMNELDESQSNSCGTDSEDDEIVEENGISKNIQLIEAFKGQLYTFIGENSGGDSKENSYNQSKDCIESNEIKKNLKVYSKKAIGMSKTTSFECETCGKCFKKRRDLNVHVRIHTGEKPFPCKTCKKVFAYSSALKAHARTHTGEKPYVCKYCNKGFTQSTHLKSHERIHTGEKPYKCKKCKTCFNQKSSLNTHEKTHK